MKFLKKVTEIDAWQVNLVQDEKTTQLPPPWVVEAIKDGTLKEGEINDQEKVLVVLTNHGPVAAKQGDWLAKGDGDIYPIQDKLFRALYVPVVERKAQGYPMLDAAINAAKLAEGQNPADVMKAAVEAAHTTAVYAVAHYCADPSEEARNKLARAFGFEYGVDDAVAAHLRRMNQISGSVGTTPGQ